MANSNILYDELTPADPLNIDQKRKMMCIYFSIVELGDWLQKEAWIFKGQPARLGIIQTLRTHTIDSADYSFNGPF